jgi:hypothetical protein
MGLTEDMQKIFDCNLKHGICPTMLKGDMIEAIKNIKSLSEKYDRKSSSIKYVVGNLFDELPIFTTKKAIIIPHIVNTLGLWGSGFVVPLGKIWPITKREYQKWYKQNFDYERNTEFILGEIQIVQVEDFDKNRGPVFVANMLAQDGIISSQNPHPIEYQSLNNCLLDMNTLALDLNGNGYDVEIHAPAFGSCRSGGHWPTIAKMIDDILAAYPIFIYTLTQEEQDNLFQ